MKLKKKREVWKDSNGVKHQPQLSGDDHTACGLPSDEDDNGEAMTTLMATSFDCPECERVVMLYKNL